MSHSGKQQYFVTKRHIILSLVIVASCTVGLWGQSAQTDSILYFPRFIISSGISSTTDTGLVLFNPTSEDASVSLALIGANGRPIGTPVVAFVPALGQIAKTGREIFGLEDVNSSLSVSSSTPGIIGYLETFDTKLTFMDGAAPADSALDLIFPVAAGPLPERTEIGLLNSNSRGTRVRLKLRAMDGTLLGESIAVVPAHGIFCNSLKNIFPLLFDFSAASHLTATSLSQNLFYTPQTLSGTSLFSGISPVSESSDVAAMNALPLTETSNAGAIPFFQIGHHLFSVLSIANVESTPSDVTITAIDSHGSFLATKDLTVPGNGGLRQPIDDIFPELFSSDTGGWLIFQSTGRIAAANLFGQEEAGALSAIPMQRLPQPLFAFPQVVQGSGFFTKISLANPGPDSSTIDLSFVDPSGSTLAGREIVLSPGAWISQRLDQFFPEMPDSIAGVVSVLASTPIFGTASVWTDSGKTMASFSPQILPESYAPAPLETFAVSGTVTLNGEPVKDVPVVLSGASGLRTSVTREDGIYVFSDLPAGQYTLYADQFGFQFVPPHTSFEITSASIRQDFLGFVAESGILVAPASIPIGSPDTQVTIYGSDFSNTAQAFAGPVRLQTTFIGPTELQVTLPAYLFEMPHRFELHVVDGSRISDPYEIVAFTQRPQLSAVIPNRKIIEGSPAAAVSFSGTGFLEGARVKINGSSEGISVTFVNSTQILAVVPASYFVYGGVYPVTVENPYPANIESNIQLLTVYFPRPAIESIDPAIVSERLEDSSGSLTLKVYGYGFRRGAVILFEDIPVPTSYCEDTPACVTEQLTATIDPGLLRSSGFKKISVRNPDPSVAPSQIMILRVESLEPTITSVFPGSATILNLPPPNNKYSLPVLIYGTNFDPRAEVQFTTPRGLKLGFVPADQVISSMQIIATITIAYPESIGQWKVEVKNPQPGGGLSGTAYFQITQASFVANPFIASISPAVVAAGGGSFLLTVDGTNFRSGSQINFYASPLPTNFVSSTQLTAEVPASLIKTAGKKPITVTNPDNGGTSNKVFIEVQ